MAAWAINLAVAFGGVPKESPLYFLGADRSTVSTLVFVLVFAFPLFRSISYLNATSKDSETAVKGLEKGAYPPNFVFFLVMLGLAGTLFGLLIGIDPTEVRSVTNSEASAAQTGMVIDNLLQGAATALLSSLWALVVAFLAASPFRAIWEWAGQLPPEEDLGLVAALQQLASDVRSLNAIAREGGTAAIGQAAVEQAGKSATAAERLGDGLERTNELLQRIETTLAQDLSESRKQRERLRQALAVLAED